MGRTSSPETLRRGFRRLLVILLAVTAIIGVWRADPFWSQGPTAATPTHPARIPSPEAELSVDPPPCVYGSAPAIAARYGEWSSTLLDLQFALPRTYVPPDLVATTEAGFQARFMVRSFLIPDLAALRRAARRAGTPIGLVAGYRSWNQQASLFSRRRAELGYAAALRKTARPGHSEHQLGTAVDFKTLGAPGVNAGWGSSPTGRWMRQNAYRFGFIESYPGEKTAVTCYAYEPWHFRYFGPALAARIHSSGLAVRQYLWRQAPTQAQR
jgi:D-alanyl-D-alanine carboxypeptidase